jgi:methylated-DNA-[protein]-cysteine S-methyltransferase
MHHPSPTWTSPVPTSDGDFVARFSDRGLCGLEFPSSRPARLPKHSLQAPPQVQLWQRLTANSLKRALAGREPGDLPPLDLSCGTDFQQRVWQAMRRIPLGQTWSYGQLAEAIGRPKAVRAVGQACGANPIPVLVPCHRVVAAGRTLGGFSAPLNWKVRLLTCEGVELPLG